MGYQKIAEVDDLWSGEMRGIEVNGEPILVVNVDDHIYAYADVCPRQKSRLSEGTLTGKVIRCARHHWEFDVCAGSGVNPRNTCLRGFPVRLHGQDILVDIDAGTALRAAVEGESGQ
jgi:nitrite reductase/ring-hydroxylating ferredoxin subunit